LTRSSSLVAPLSFLSYFFCSAASSLFFNSALCFFFISLLSLLSLLSSFRDFFLSPLSFQNWWCLAWLRRDTGSSLLRLILAARQERECGGIVEQRRRELLLADG
jgi:hypothetical protein